MEHKNVQKLLHFQKMVHKRYSKSDPQTLLKKVIHKRYSKNDPQTLLKNDPQMLLNFK